VSAALRDVWGDTLVELCRERSDVYVLDGDLGNSTKADKVDREVPERFLAMGIAEQNMMGVAAGMATCGLIPWLSSFAAFFTHRSADQIRVVVAQTGLPVKIGAAYAGLLTGLTGKTHQDIEDLAIMRAMPGMTVLAPADPAECRALIRWATASPGPVYLRLARDAERDVFDAGYQARPGLPVVLRPGGRVRLVGTGVQTARLVDAAESLAASGLDVGLVHLPFVKPLDEAALAAALSGAELVVTAEEHNIIGGLGGLVAETVTSHRPVSVLRLGVRDEWGESAPNAALLDRHGLSAQRVARRVLAEVSG
jgi:transketolase